jgi:hypothetical protein
MTLVIVLGSGGAASAGSGSSDPVADTTSSAAAQLADVTDTVSNTTDDVTDTVSNTTDDVTDTVSNITDDASHTASGTIGDVSDAAASDIDGRATSGHEGIRGDGADAADVMSSDAGTGWRAGGSPSGDGPLLGRRYFAPASLVLATGSAREFVSLIAYSLRGCGNLHRDGDPIPCAGDAPMGDGVLGIVLGATGLAVLSLLALAAALAASGTTSLVIGRTREA